MVAVSRHTDLALALAAGASRRLATALHLPAARRPPAAAAKAVFALLGCVLCGGCRPNGSGSDRPLLVVVSGDTAGWIVPCGCASNQSGGLPRRGTCVEQLRDESDVIAADVGGAPGGTSLYDRIKFEAVLRGELAMGIAAHNVGQSEARLGPDYLRLVVQELGVPLVSANVCDKQEQLVAAPMRLVKAAGRRVALVGVLSPRYATDQLRVMPPRQAVLNALRAAAGRYDAVVVLAYLPEDELQRLAETLPEADVIVGGPTGQPIPPKRIGPVLLASATRQGKFLARFDAPAHRSSEHWTGSIIELDERFEDHAFQLTNLRRFREELAWRDLTPEDTSFARPLNTPEPSYRIAGNSQCAKCHLDDDRLWKASKHAQAWDSLRAKGAEVDPECQQCHTTGYGLPGGFASVKGSPKVVGVGCEGCHGPSQGHVNDPKTPTPHQGRAKDYCRACHDLENSPKFNYDEYWARIPHGESPATEPSPAAKKNSEDSP